MCSLNMRLPRFIGEKGCFSPLAKISKVIKSSKVGKSKIDFCI